MTPHFFAQPPGPVAGPEQVWGAVERSRRGTGRPGTQARPRDLRTFSEPCIITCPRPASRLPLVPPSQTCTFPAKQHLEHSRFFKNCIYLFIFGCVGSSLLRAGFSLQWLRLLWSTGSRHVSFSSCDSQASVAVACRLSSCGTQALERRLSSCGARV